MTEAAQRYNELRFELLFKREEAGGALPQEQESDFAAELDHFWRMMEDEEQEEVEKSLTRKLERSPEAPRHVDRPISSGQHLLPRIPEAA